MHLLRRLAVLVAVLMIAAVAGAAAQAPAPPPAGVPAADEALSAVKARVAPDRRLVHFDLKTRLQNDTLVVEGDVEGAAAKEAALAALRAAGFTRIEDHIVALPDPRLGEKRFGIVRVSVANVKGKPSHMSDMATQTVMGWPVRVLGASGGWYYVHTEPDGYLGWIEELQLTLVDEAGQRAWTDGARVIVTVPSATVTETPSATGVPVTDVVMGALLRLSGNKGSWVAVELPDGRRGHLPATAAKAYAPWVAATKPTADGIEREALRFMGVPYLWGGTSSKGFDCSGYSKTVFRMNGIELPRDADQQGDTGTAVPIDDQMSALRKGDLLFFGSKATAERPERITHVGIYVGNGEFLHASGLVRRNSLLPASPLFSESLRTRLLRVRRVF